MIGDSRQTQSSAQIVSLTDTSDIVCGFVHRQGWALIAVVCGHLLLGGFLIRGIAAIPRDPEATVPLLLEQSVESKTLSERPHLMLAASIAAIPTPRPELKLLEIAAEADSPVSESFAVLPPHPLSASLDQAPYVRLANLSASEAASVVLRIEVMGTGNVGRVEIDTSSRSPAADQAAIAYVRALRWVAGTVGERPATLWIRWGVYLHGAS